MNTFEEQTGFRAIDADRIAELVSQEIGLSYRQRGEAFGDRVQAIALLPVEVVAEWYGEPPQLTQYRPPVEPTFFPPDYLISGLY